jgi:hypothetical protein
MLISLPDLDKIKTRDKKHVRVTVSGSLPPGSPDQHAIFYVGALHFMAKSSRINQSFSVSGCMLFFNQRIPPVIPDSRLFNPGKTDWKSHVIV